MLQSTEAYLILWQINLSCACKFMLAHKKTIYRTKYSYVKFEMMFFCMLSLFCGILISYCTDHALKEPTSQSIMDNYAYLG